jgi:hypothetical protein
MLGKAPILSKKMLIFFVLIRVGMIIDSIISGLKI